MSGIQPYSKPVKAGQWVIFSASAFTADYVDERLSEIHAPYKRLQGRFNGIDEPSWIIHETDWRLSAVQSLAIGEYAILMLGERDPTACMCRVATIVTLEENPVYIQAGWLQEATAKRALTSDAFSYDPEDHRYWQLVQEKPVPVKPKVVRMGPLVYDFTAPHAAGRYPKAVAYETNTSYVE